MKAVTIRNSGIDDQLEAVVETRPLPKLRAGYFLVKVMAVAINPADLLVLDFKMAVPGSLAGCDYAGTVVELGSDVQRDFKLGDRVCGCTRSTDPAQFENGTFAEYIVVKADLQLRIPSGMGFEQAASLGVTTLTTGRFILEDGSVNTSKQNPRQILVYGGSSAMGTMVIQFAKLANFTVLTTSAPHNADLVRSYGADFVVDHYSPDAPAELLAIAKKNALALGPLTLCVDNISRADSAAFCAKVLAPQDETQQSDVLYSVLTPLTPPLPGITTLPTVGYSFLGEEYEFMGQVVPASTEDFERARRFAVVAERLLQLGHVKPHPVDVRTGGLEGVVKTGLPELRNGKVSGKKLVYVM
ncbi:uncharacterized protein A1O9_06541 [Exophiala aquamarina CBS 119918]|uniref:Enoyl reductase (ER) domain-containing protein n=1 Tax=Exophiala aquamarina CBS 119918 TaxID=1182545 RepID=A0A072PSW8_9EURO|nr:uncharacterized protein A1O9_06541 [Exophiala aquamarina CBS 119918]KEF58615.1 hypothetical protein A1O9_06541 [Exophiala aquamarina CBS 119918]